MFILKFSSFIVCDKILSIVPCAIQYVLVGYSMNIIIISIQFSSVQSLIRVQLFATP